MSMTKKPRVRPGVYCVIGLDHGLSLDELVQFEIVVSERLHGTALPVTGMVETTELHPLNAEERRATLLNEKWLDFEAPEAHPPIEIVVGEKAMAISFPSRRFLWAAVSGESMTEATLRPVMEALHSAFAPGKFLVASEKYVPGSWVQELVSEGMTIAQVIRRFETTGEPPPRGEAELLNFLGVQGPERLELCEQYFLV